MRTTEISALLPRRPRRLRIAVAVLLAFLCIRHVVRRSGDGGPQNGLEVTKEKIAAAMGNQLEENRFPDTIQLGTADEAVTALTRYTINAEVQSYVENLFDTYRPDYGAFVALDAESGRVLSLVSYTREWSSLGNLTLKAAFPAASIFKIITAAAALDQQKMTPSTMIPFSGSNHTLYRRNVTGGAWTRMMSLREAFAKSVNTVFAKIGLFLLTPPHIAEYARRFQFNRAISADIPVQSGKVPVPEDDRWALAELASGYNRVAVMSPLQGALIAAAVANDGVMMEPYMIDRLEGPDGHSVYESRPRLAAVTMKPESAAELRTMMHETVRSGTSRKAFRDLLRRKNFAEIDIGGKTGSLTGLYPKGKCDWFVGYARANGRRLAVAALTVNEEKWRVKSSYLARAVIERYFRNREYP